MYIDKKYINYVMSQIDLGTQTGTDHWVGRCPICGDSKKSKTKKRFHINLYNGDYMVGCFNCNYHAPFKVFLKNYYPHLYQDYNKEKFEENIKSNSNNSNKSKNVKSKHNLKKSKTNALFTPSNEVKRNVITATKMQKANDYLNKRKVPEFNKKYFAHTYNFKKLLKSSGYQKYDKFEEEERLVILLLDTNKELLGLQGRAYNSNKIRYITIQLNENELYFLNVNKNPETDFLIVTEGVFDAAMFKNSAAMLSSNLIRASKLLKDFKKIYAFDNEPRNKSVMAQMELCANEVSKSNSKDKLFIPDSKMTEKDFNELVVKGIMSHNELENYVMRNSYSGAEALLRFKMYKKC